MPKFALILFFFGSLLQADERPAIDWPAHFPPPLLDEESKPSLASIELGEILFHDQRLSVNNGVSCAFCHMPEEAFSDPALQPWGVRPAQTTRRHSMLLFNLAWKPGPFRWDGDETSLRAQILRPISDPLEMGEKLANIPTKLKTAGEYPALFEKAFGDDEVTSERVAVAMEHYLFSLISADSKYEQAERDEVELTAEEELGKALFFGPVAEKGAGCFQCHPAPLFSDHQFHNNGLVPRRGDRGREEVTGLEADRYRFATPSLRNIEVTAPYMYDGRFATLEEVVAHYSQGLHESETLAPVLRTTEEGGLQLSDDEQAALVAFLKTLSDPAYLEDEDELVKEVDPFSL